MAVVLLEKNCLFLKIITNNYLVESVLKVKRDIVLKRKVLILYKIIYNAKQNFLVSFKDVFKNSLTFLKQ